MATVRKVRQGTCTDVTNPGILSSPCTPQRKVSFRCRQMINRHYYACQGGICETGYRTWCRLAKILGEVPIGDAGRDAVRIGRWANFMSRTKGTTYGARYKHVPWCLAGQALPRPLVEATLKLVLRNQFGVGVVLLFFPSLLLLALIAFLAGFFR